MPGAAPIGPMLGHAGPTRGVRTRGALTPLPAGTVLCVITGFPSDHRKELDPNDPKDAALYRAAAYAFQRQDLWDSTENGDYWAAHLPLWPNRKGPPNAKEANASVLAYGIHVGLTPEEAIRATGLEHDDLRDRGIYEMADQMMAETAAGPGGLRVPRVVTQDELHARKRWRFNVSQTIEESEWHRMGHGAKSPVKPTVSATARRGYQAIARMLAAAQN